VKNYYRVMLGKQSVHAQACFAGNFIGADMGISQDLTGHLPDDWRTFNAEFRPVWLQGHPGKSKISAGLSCGFLWTVSKGIAIGDFVLCPDGSGSYRVGEVTGDYTYAEGQILPHRRAVTWLPKVIEKAAMSEALRNSAGSIGTVSDISGYHDEIEALLGSTALLPIVSTDPTIEDPSAFALEKHLEDFLVENWAQTELGTKYDIFTEDGEQVGKQYQTDAGIIDILAISKDKKELLVIELKKGKTSDVVIGQTLRYMGFATEILAEADQKVRGMVIALKDDPKIHWALKALPTVDFYRYQIDFKLVKG
jgi:restriction system protein